MANLDSVSVIEDDHEGCSWMSFQKETCQKGLHLE